MVTTFQQQEPAPRVALAAAVALMVHYFDIREGDAWTAVLSLSAYHPPSWIRIAVIEALYQGRYKVISVEQILDIWRRRGKILAHFNREFEAIVTVPLPDRVQAQLRALAREHQLEHRQQRQQNLPYPNQTYPNPNHQQAQYSAPSVLPSVQSIASPPEPTLENPALPTSMDASLESDSLESDALGSDSRALEDTLESKTSGALEANISESEDALGGDALKADSIPSLPQVDRLPKVTEAEEVKPFNAHIPNLPSFSKLAKISQILNFNLTHANVSEAQGERRLEAETSSERPPETLPDHQLNPTIAEEETKPPATPASPTSLIAQSPWSPSLRRSSSQIDQFCPTPDRSGFDRKLLALANQS